MFTNLKIGKKLGTSFGIMAILAIILGAIAIHQIKDVHEDVLNITNKALPRTEQAKVIYDNVNLAARAIRNAILADDPADRKKEIERITLQASPLVTKTLEELTKTAVTKEQKDALKAVTDARSVYLPEAKKLFTLIEKGKMVEAKKILVTDFRKIQNNYFIAVESLIALEKKNITALEAESASTYRTSIMLVSIILLVAVAASGTIGYLVTRSITVPINKAVEIGDQVAAGVTNITINTSSKDETGDLMRSLENMVHTIKSMVEDTNRLSEEIAIGRLMARADDSGYSGDFKKVVAGVNNTIERLAGLLNAMPAPAMIIDNDFTIQYMNEIGAKVGNKTPEQLVGTKCYDHFKTSDCKTDNCACYRAIRDGKESTHETDAHPGDLNLDISYTGIPLRDGSGKIIGAFEIVTDQTSIKQAARLSQKIAAYQVIETRKVVEGLTRLSHGDTSFTMSTEAGDMDTQETKQIFANIGDAINTCTTAVNNLISDATMLSKAAVDGKLSTRADANRHQGDFRKIVEGVNETLDAVIGPLNVAAQYVDRISKGDLPARITDNYNGDFNALKNNLNLLIEAMTDVTDIADNISQGNLAVEAKMRSNQDSLMKALATMIVTLRELADTSGHIADGDLTVNVKPASDQDLIGNAFEKMVINLRDIVGNVGSSSDSIATATRQIAAGNADMAQRTEEQASSLEEIASSMEELTSTVKQNADNSQQANQLAIEASEVAVTGGNVIGKVVSTMDSISSSSKKISDIIGVIDGIAFQTNILALNAAVEAARAGEQGRGFAVVAGEVRNLAQRSASAAKEIKALISDSVEKVDNGGKLVSEAGKTMQEIVTSIKRVTDIMGEISAASVEQSSGIEQVNVAITQLDEITQQNASLVQQSSAAAAALEDQAGILVDAVDRFNLGTNKTKRNRPALDALSKTTHAHTGETETRTQSTKTAAANGYHAKAGKKQSNVFVHPAPQAKQVKKAVGLEEDWNEF